MCYISLEASSYKLYNDSFVLLICQLGPVKISDNHPCLLGELGNDDRDDSDTVNNDY